MENEAFDNVARNVAARATRRGAALGLAAGIAAALLRHDEAVAKPRNKDGSCRRKGKRAVLLCHKGKPKCVHRRKVEAHLQHGDALGDCSLPGGSQTCQNPNLPCNANPTFCGDGCACFVTTSGGSICANNGFNCRPGTTCTRDEDCDSITGSGSACVPTTGCQIPGCSDTGNACAAPCQA